MEESYIPTVQHNQQQGPLEKLVEFVEGQNRTPLSSVFEKFSPAQQGTKQTRGRCQNTLQEIQKQREKARSLLDQINAALETGKQAGNIRKLKNDLLDAAQDVLSQELELRSGLLVDLFEKLENELNEREREQRQTQNDVKKKIQDQLREVGFPDNNLPPIDGTVSTPGGITYQIHHPLYIEAVTAVRKTESSKRDLDEHQRLNNAAIQQLRTQIEELLNRELS